MAFSINLPDMDLRDIVRLGTHAVERFGAKPRHRRTARQFRLFLDGVERELNRIEKRRSGPSNTGR